MIEFSALEESLIRLQLIKMNPLIKIIKKASEMDLTAGLFGRTLSEYEMKKARVNFIEGKNSDFERRYFTQGEEFVVEETLSMYNTIPDSSRGWKKPREGYIPHTRIISTYTSEGKLKEKEIKDLRLHTNEVVSFSPPGRIIGRRKVDA